MSKKYRENSPEFMFPVTPKAEIDRCLNCTRTICYGTCSSEPRRKIVKGRVQCVETGEMFKTQREAAESVGCCKSAMSTHLKGKTATCGGLHWRFVPGVGG